MDYDPYFPEYDDSLDQLNIQRINKNTEEREQFQQELDQNSFEPKTLVDDPGFKTLSNADIEKLSKPPSRQTTSIKSALREPPAQSPVKWIVASVGLLLLGAVGSLYAIGFFDSEQASYNVKKRVAPNR